jgi:uncharacterized protein YjaG (DUF416 family)
MYKFVEAQLIADIRRLHTPGIVCFAVALATRQLPNYEWFGSQFDAARAKRPRQIVEQIWHAIESNVIHAYDWNGTLAEVMDLMPEEDEEWGIAHSLADDALSSLAYTIRCMLSGEPQEAAWAARRAYEAADQAAIKIMNVDFKKPGTEVGLLASPIVQRELSRQHRDLTLLVNKETIDTFGELSSFAIGEDLLLDSERALLTIRI